jgi:hypothetical protein
MKNSRFIVFNADCGWIQGDIAAARPEEADTPKEAQLSEPTDNAEWQVFIAPADLPFSYSAVDAELVQLLRQSSPVATVPNSLLTERSYALAS